LLIKLISLNCDRKETNMKILIGADLVPHTSDVDLFIKGDSLGLLGEELKAVVDSADFRIFNLETALCDEESPTRKAGPNIGSPTASINGYKALGVDLLSISNNHVMDHGRKGFVSTIKTLEEAGIAYTGGGFTKEEAIKPYIFEKEGIKVGVYACCEHEFSWIEDYGCGSNGFDPLNSLDHIAELKAQVDYCIVLYHGGKEHYRYPSPYLRKVCRRIVDKGADIVLCQHTHCVGTEEDYKGGKIVFGQGNFLFNLYAGIEHWKTSLAVMVDLTKDGAKVDYIPIETNGTGTRYSHNPEILAGFHARSEEIKQEGFIEKEFEKLATETVLTRYFRGFYGPDATVDKIYEHGIRFINGIDCEVHNETIITGVKALNKLGKYGETKVD